MLATRLILGSALLAGLVSSAQALPVPGQPGTNTKHHHTHHLERALKDLHAAQNAIKAGNAAQAAKDVRAALVQTEDAIKAHHLHHQTQSQSGLTGLVAKTHHHHHHSALHQAVTDMRAAEKQLASGKASAALRDVEKAERAIAHVLKSHHHTTVQ